MVLYKLQKYYTYLALSQLLKIQKIHNIRDKEGTMVNFIKYLKDILYI